MKTLFQLYCLMRGVPWYASTVLWLSYHSKFKTDWFRQYYGHNVFLADVHFMRTSSLFVDFLTDEGIGWTLTAFKASFTDQEFRADVWRFSSHFVKEIMEPFIVNKFDAPVKHVEREDYVIMRGLFVRSLSAWLARRNKVDDADHYIPYIKQYLIA